MSYPWSNVPPASFEFGLADHVGCLAFFVVGGLHRDVATSFGTRDAVRCGIVLLDGPEAGKEFEDVLVFNARPVSRLRNAAGQIILCRITYAEAKGGNNKPVELLDGTPEDAQLAMGWHSYYPQRLDQIRAGVIASYQAEERKTTVTSQPHPTHAGSRTPANNWGSQPPPQQQSGNGGWGAQPAAAPATGVQQAWGQPPAQTATTTAASPQPPWMGSGPAATREEAGF